MIPSGSGYPWYDIITIHDFGATEFQVKMLTMLKGWGKDGVADAIRYIQTFSCEVQKGVPYIDVPYKRDADILENASIVSSDMGFRLTFLAGKEEYDTANMTFILDSFPDKTFAFRIWIPSSYSESTVQIRVPSYTFCPERRHGLMGHSLNMAMSDIQKLTVNCRR